MQQQGHLRSSIVRCFFLGGGAGTGAGCHGLSRYKGLGEGFHRGSKQGETAKLVVASNKFNVTAFSFSIHFGTSMRIAYATAGVGGSSWRGPCAEQL